MPFYINVFFVEAPVIDSKASSGDATATEPKQATESGEAPTADAKPSQEDPADAKPSAAEEEDPTNATPSAEASSGTPTDVDKQKPAAVVKEEVESLDKSAPSDVNVGKHDVPRELEDTWRELITSHFTSVGVEVSLEVDQIEGVAVLAFFVEIGDVDLEKLAAADPQLMNKAFNFAGKMMGQESVEDKAKKRLENLALLKLPHTLHKQWRHDHPDAQDVVVTCKSVADQPAWLAVVLQAAELGTCPWRQAPARLLTDAWNEDDEREHAQKLGLLRPWLLLASMPMQMRTDIAGELGITISACTPGQEATAILLQEKVGICPRIDGVKQKFAAGVMRVFKGDDESFHSSWTHILLRLLAKTESHDQVPKELAHMDGPQHFAATKNEANKVSMEGDESLTPIGQLEKIALEAVQRMWLDTLSEEEKAEVEEAADSCNSQALSNAGVSDLEKLMCLARSQESDDKVPLTSQMMEKLKTVGKRVALKQVATMVAPGLGQIVLARNISLAVWGSNPLGCEKPVMLILLHRLALAADGINIDTLMPKESAESS